MARKPIAVIYPDPRSSFSSSTNNGDRFVAAAAFVDQYVKKQLCLVHNCATIEPSSVPDVMQNRDTIETFKNELTKTPACCNFPAFLESTGAADPHGLMERMIKASVNSVVKDYVLYRKQKDLISTRRLERHYNKAECSASLSELLKEIDRKTPYTPVSRRASLLPPIRPPVSRPAVNSPASPKLVQLEYSSEAEDPSLVDEPDLIEEHLVSAQRKKGGFVTVAFPDHESGLVEIESDEEQSRLNVSTQFAQPSESLIEMPQSKKQHHTYSQAQALLKKALQDPQQFGLNLDMTKRYTYVMPTDKTMDELLKMLTAANMTFDLSKQKKLLKTHLMFKDGDKLRNLYGVVFSVSGNQITDNRKGGLSYDIVKKLGKFPVTKLGSVRYLVIENLFPPGKVL